MDRAKDTRGPGKGAAPMTQEFDPLRCSDAAFEAMMAGYRDALEQRRSLGESAAYRWGYLAARSLKPAEADEVAKAWALLRSVRFSNKPGYFGK
jgi:hypothetical protein